jgi:hypothetical protein
VTGARRRPADSPESYEQFIAEHPESTLVATARERLQQLAEEKDWRAAAQTDSREAYQQFLAQYPAGKWAKEAQVRIDNFAAAPGGAAPASASSSADAPSSVAPAGEGASLPDAALPPASGGVRCSARRVLVGGTRQRPNGRNFRAIPRVCSTVFHHASSWAKRRGKAI